MTTCGLTPDRSLHTTTSLWQACWWSVVFLTCCSAAAADSLYYGSWDGQTGSVPFIGSKHSLDRCSGSTPAPPPGLNPRRFQASWSLKMIETRMDDDLCIIFGSIPKAGSSTIRIWLKSLGGTHNADAAQRLGRGKIVQKQLGYSGVLPDSLRKECFTFTFLRDPVDRYVSGLYESHRKSDGPSAVNVPELTYAFVADGNTAGKWLDPKQNSIFNVGQLDYLRTRQSNSSTSTWDFVGRLDHFKEDWMQVHSLVHAKFGRNPWDPSLNPTPDHHGASSASATARDSLPSNLIKIICTLYADDYCCLNLPIPSQCDIACHHTTT